MVKFPLGFSIRIPEYHESRKDNRPGKIATGVIWGSKSGKTPPAVADVTPQLNCVTVLDLRYCHKGKHQNGLIQPALVYHHAG